MEEKNYQLIENFVKEISEEVSDEDSITIEEKQEIIEVSPEDVVNHQEIVSVQEEKLPVEMPKMEVKVPSEEIKEIITDTQLVGIYDEILGFIRTETKEIDQTLNKLMDMVFNSCDASQATKEAMVNLIKLKTEQADKMTKIADLMTRVKLKEQNTFPKYLSANQNNTFNIKSGSKNKREIIDILKRKNADLEEKEKNET